MEVHGSPSLFSREENQEEADIWVRFMAMGQLKSLEWAKKMVAAQGVQQLSETPAVTNTDEVQASDSGLCLLSEESDAAPAKSGPRRAKKDNEEQEAAGTSGVPLTAGGLAPVRSMPIAQEKTGHPAPGASGQGLQVGLGKMMEAMHSFMASAKALAGLGMDEQGASNRRECAGQVWGQDTNSLPKVQGEASAPGAEVSDRVASDTLAGGSDKRTVVRPDPPLLSRRSSQA
ncbi:hypothetical protein NDU88_006672 [Pleurodeles waltl]|uniref:Uncharacterized protein n=1 Tax=Pleurodeles waltl TaxID=8319 RepID=A0AAV7QPP2_PLEWA|nr:hypothetical protein NDU88_006672 [Pleurodeles waltl]